ncbi:aldo/keto reductase [Micromonospora sp. RB23]
MNTDVRDFRLLYGCMGLGGAWDDSPYGPREIEQAEAVVVAAMDAGITAFDHADIYRRGKSEAVFGEVLARTPGLRERIVLQSKCGIRLPDGGHGGRYDLRGPHIVRSVEESLTRLRTDVLDVLLLHRPDPLADPDETAEALGSLYEQGLVRQFGVSNMSAAQIAHLQSRLDQPLVVNQLEMSLHKRNWVEAEVSVNTTTTTGFPLGTVQYCVSERMGMQAWGALAQGRFTGRAGTEAEEKTTRLLVELAEAKRTTPEAVLLWWLQRHPVRVAPVVGTTRPERIGACADAVGREPDLSHEEWYQLWVTARGAALP